MFFLSPTSDKWLFIPFRASEREESLSSKEHANKAALLVSNSYIGPAFESVFSSLPHRI